MADFKISDLPLADPMTGTELMGGAGGVSKKRLWHFSSHIGSFKERGNQRTSPC